MSRRAVLWVAFFAVHVGVAVLGHLQPNQPMGDVNIVYEPWSAAAMAGNGQIIGLTSSWVYPVVALLPMIFAHAFAWWGYLVGWAILVSLVDAAAFALLVGRGRSNGRTAAAWFWLAYIVALGPVGMYRLDGFTVPFAIAACLWLIGRPFIASTLLAIATWIKVWPAAILAAALIAVRRRAEIIGGAVAFTALTLGVIFIAGGGQYAFSFISDQTTRGLQIEAPVSTFFVWRAALGLVDSVVYYDTDMYTFQVTGPFLDALIAIMTPLLALSMLALAAVGAFKVWQRASFAALFPSLSLAFILAFIVVNKVGSPQYMTWLIAPLVIGLVIDRRSWWGPSILALATALLTQVVYPLTYAGLMRERPDVFSVVLLTGRNILLVVLFVWVVVRLVQVRVRQPAEKAAASISLSADDEEELHPRRELRRAQQGIS